MPETSDAQPQDAGHIPMTEEMDSAKWTLPPMVPILGALVGVAVVVALIAFTTRATPVVEGAITRVAAAEQEANTMVAVQVKLDNKIQKRLWIKDIRSELETADGKTYPDHASPAADLGRYIQAFPALKSAAADPLAEELKIPAGISYTGYTIFSYPVSKAAFDARESLSIRIEMYDQPILVLRQP